MFPKGNIRCYWVKYVFDSSLAVDTTGSLAATGQVGKDAYIAVWDTSSSDPMSVIHDAHTHTVSVLAFSHNKQVRYSARKYVTLVF